MKEIAVSLNEVKENITESNAILAFRLTKLESEISELNVTMKDLVRILDRK